MCFLFSVFCFAFYLQTSNFCLLRYEVCLQFARESRRVGCAIIAPFPLASLLLTAFSIPSTYHSPPRMYLFHSSRFFWSSVRLDECFELTVLDLFSLLASSCKTPTSLFWPTLPQNNASPLDTQPIHSRLLLIDKRLLSHSCCVVDCSRRAPQITTAASLCLSFAVCGSSNLHKVYEMLEVCCWLVNIVCVCAREANVWLERTLERAHWRETCEGCSSAGLLEE